jgi:hypothetical protein
MNVERINRAARRLGALVPSVDTPTDKDLDPLMRLFLDTASREGDVDVRRAIDGIRLIEELSDKVLRDKSYDLGWAGRRSAERWLISDALPKIYEQHFRRPFRMSRLNGRSNGPGFRFGEAVLSVMRVVNQNGKPFQPTGIEHHWRSR